MKATKHTAVILAALMLVIALIPATAFADAQVSINNLTLKNATYTIVTDEGGVPGESYKIVADTITGKGFIGWKVSNSSSTWYGAIATVTDSTIYIPAGLTQMYGATVEPVCKTPVADITLDPAAKTLTAAGEKFTIAATVSPTDADDASITWASNNESVVTVSATGEVTAVANGIAPVSTTANDGSEIISCCRVMVNNPIPYNFGFWRQMDVRKQE